MSKSEIPSPQEILELKKIAQEALNAGKLTIYRKWAYEVMANPTAYPSVSVVNAAKVVRIGDDDAS